MTPPLVLSTVMIDPPTTLVVGAVTALISMKLIARGGLPEVWRAAVFSVIFSALYSLAVGWMFFFRPDWMFVYLLDTTTVPLVPLYLVFAFACVGLGFVSALGVGLLIHLKKAALAWATALSCIATLGLLAFMTAAQYAKVGTTQDFHAGVAKALTEDSTMVVAMNVVTGVLVVGGVTLIVLQVRRTMKGAQAP
ncbi:MAG: hypothetical protein IT380_12825 [Myxococcales bacterium]|nr:hypothetical protein [Myxococcales bacterium]